LVSVYTADPHPDLPSFPTRRSSDLTLSGHSLGNLLIAALVNQSRGDFEQAIEVASDVLAIRGRVVPSTLAHVTLRALMEDGSELDRKSTRLNSSHQIISYAVFCLKK